MPDIGDIGMGVDQTGGGPVAGHLTVGPVARDTQIPRHRPMTIDRPHPLGRRDRDRLGDLRIETAPLHLELEQPGIERSIGRLDQASEPVGRPVGESSSFHDDMISNRCSPVNP